MNHPNRPPLASPGGNTGPLPSSATVPGDWKSAPKIVRDAYVLTWVSIATLYFCFPIVVTTPSNSGVERFLVVLLYCLLFVFNIVLNRGIKGGKRWAWIGQILLSCLGLLGFPLWTAIQGYILFQWFKPETKAWFGQS